MYKVYQIKAFKGIFKHRSCMNRIRVSNRIERRKGEERERAVNCIHKREIIQHNIITEETSMHNREINSCGLRDRFKRAQIFYNMSRSNTDLQNIHKLRNSFNLSC